MRNKTLGGFTQEDFLDRLDLDSESGTLTWKERPIKDFKDSRSYKSWNARFAGKPALTNTNANGYKRGSFMGVPLLAHRVVFFMHHGFITDRIDHVRGVAEGNGVDNLREATHSQNLHNRGRNKNNKSGYKGVFYNKATDSYRSMIMCDRRSQHLGLFNNPEDAAKAYDNAAIALHGEFAIVNSPERKETT